MRSWSAGLASSPPSVPYHDDGAPNCTLRPRVRLGMGRSWRRRQTTKTNISAMRTEPCIMACTMGGCPELGREVIGVASEPRAFNGIIRGTDRRA